ncbi:MAG: hypothetical protein E2O69_07765 [Deltaproteobacteria bacterium]|nr:MAG: hypothetical protein E2O69_07765 [Deltaproteobacteria bacterium]
MQRGRLFTAGDAVSSAPSLDGVARLALPVLWLVLAAAVAVVLLENPKTPVYDQAGLVEARLWGPSYPAPPRAFTSQLVVIGLRPFVPDSVELHEVLRVAAMLFWVGAAAWLGSLLLRDRIHFAVYGLLLFSSQFPFLWLSSELLTGGCLFLTLAAALSGAPVWLLGTLLALLALCKIEMLLVSLALAGWLVWKARDEGRGPAVHLLGSFAVVLAVLLAPGLVLIGWNYYFEYDDGTSRGFATFTQHYASLVAPLQRTPGPNPWLQPEVYLQRAFPGANSMSDVVFAPGLAYLDFVALSAARGIRKIGWLFSWGWLAVPVLVWARRRAGVGLDDRERLLWISFIGVIPMVLFAYPHIRYFARYYPLFWLLVGLGIERLQQAEPSSDEKGGRRACLVAASGAVLLALMLNGQRVSHGLAYASVLSSYWFPD